MNPVIGKQLLRARESRGISLEEASHATRIRKEMIEALEADNMDAFANRAYAKNFLLLYGRYLGLDVKSVASEIDTGLHVTVGNYQYLTHANETTDGPARPGDFARPHRLPSWGPVLAVCAVTVVTVSAFMLWLNMSRIRDVSSFPDAQQGRAREAVEPLNVGAQPVKATVANPGGNGSVAQVEASVPAPIEPPIQPAVPEVIPPPVASNQAPFPVYPKDAPPPVPTVIRRAPAPVAKLIGNAAESDVAHEPVTSIDGVEVRAAKVISPVARLASNDAAFLASVDNGATAPQTAPPLVGLTPVDAPEVDEDQSPLAKDPNTIEIEPIKKTWIVIRRVTGTSPIFEDYLYPNTRPMRLPAGKYIIEVRENDAVEIRKAGQMIAYTAGGLKLE